MTEIDRTYLKTAVSRRRGLHVFGFIIVTAMFAMAVWHAAGIIAQSKITYQQAEGTVIGEDIRKERVGTRRGKYWKDRRYVDVQYEYGGAERKSSMRDDSLQVGDRVSVWVKTDSDTLAITTAKPNPIDPWGWIYGGIWLLLGFFSLVGVFASIKRTGRIGRFDPSGRQPDFLLTLDNEDVSSTKGTITLRGTTVTRVDQTPRRAQFMTSHRAMPPAQQPPQQLYGYYFTVPQQGKPLDGWTVLQLPEQNVFFPAESFGSIAT